MNNSDELRKKPIEPLATPQTLFDEFPISEFVTENINASRKSIKNILSGQDPRLLVIIGPCSIHDVDAAKEYAEKLLQLRYRYQDRLEIIMRTYFEKPRTVVGWKGLISDPELNNSNQLNKGIRLARKFLLDINQLGMPTATEFLDGVIGQYISDLISWGAIGARTTESQIHREMASALPCPIGFKNGTDGNIKIAIDAIRAARAEHLFLTQNNQGQMTIYHTKGNPYGHIIMRGGHTPNYFPEDIADACQKLNTFSLPEQVIVDFSHANCQKRHRQQFTVAKSIAEQIQSGSRAIAGIMAESFLVEGTQHIEKGKTPVYGQSITDPCLGWDDTDDLIHLLADAVDSRF